jgi:hypothetical protein
MGYLYQIFTKGKYSESHMFIIQGTYTVTATAKDPDENGQYKTTSVSFTVARLTIDYTLTVSESGIILGSEPIDGNAFSETSDRKLTVNLTSPVGAATIRHFTVSKDIENDYSLKVPSGESVPLLTKDGNVFLVSIPQGFSGQAVLKIGAFKVTLNVQTQVQPTLALKAGETFFADGIEWRCLMQENNEMLITSEHIISTHTLHPHNNSWSYIRWGRSNGRNKLNGNSQSYGDWNQTGDIYINDYAGSGFLQTLTTLSSKITEKQIFTPNGTIATNNPAVSGYEATSDKVFFFSAAEIYYRGVDSEATYLENYYSPYEEITGGDTATAAERTNGNTVIFSDSLSMTATSSFTFSIYSDAGWWLRDASFYRYGLFVNCASGIARAISIEESSGLRPAMWLNLAL